MVIFRTAYPVKKEDRDFIGSKAWSISLYCIGVVMGDYKNSELPGLALKRPW